MRHPIRLSVLALCVLAWPCGLASSQDDDDEDLQPRINKVIDKGVTWLKRQQQEDGTWNRNREIGATALAGWTLLESGVKPAEGVITKAAAAVRKALVSERKNYNISLSLIFLDRLGDSRDDPLIEALAIRLLTAQLPDGGWSYYSREVAAAEQARLKKIIADRDNTPVKPAPAGVKQLSKQTKDILDQLARKPLPPPEAATSDNSNTQFAMIALWMAGRRGIPVSGPMARVEKHFRDSQWDEGSWTYMPTYKPDTRVPLDKKSYSMTCAGLLGLALGHASDKDRGDKTNIFKDPQVLQGFRHLDRILNGQVPGLDSGKHFYFLWSLERMAVVYDLKSVGKIPWYPWGAAQLVKSQERNGSWQGTYAAGGCDTCFALLFLKRVNIVEDLTLTLHGIPAGKVAVGDPLIKSAKPKDDEPLPSFIEREKPKAKKDGKPGQSSRADFSTNPELRLPNAPQIENIKLPAACWTGPTPGVSRKVA